MKPTRKSQWTICLMVALLLISTTIDAYGELEEQPVPPPRKNAMELEVAAASLGLSYARWTWGRWFLGVGAGLGLTLMIDNFDEGSIWGVELGHLRGFISRRAFSWLTIDAGPYLGLSGHEPNGDLGATAMCGAEVTALVGWRHVKIGPSVQAGWLPEWDNKSYVALTPVTLRLTLDW